MAIKKLPTGDPFNNIWKWLYEKTKVFTPNPMKPFEKDTTKEKIMNYNNLRELLIETHAPTGKINKIINEVNKLIQKVAKNETDISIIQKRLDIIDNVLKLKSTASHSHMATSVGAPTGPPLVRKGGKLQGGGFTKPVATSREENLKRQLINDIKRLQN
tara:strand:- start:189 stop:665 length:477 start_codon:yes stop_codon:yes gene_type:complete